MGWQPDTPESRSSTRPVTVSITGYRIEGYRIDPAGKEVRIFWSEGEAGPPFRAVNAFDDEFPLPDAFFDRTPIENNRRADMDRMMWEVLRTNRRVPAGSFTTDF